MTAKPPRTLLEFNQSTLYLTEAKYLGVKTSQRQGIIHYHWKITVIPRDSRGYLRLSRARHVYLDIASHRRLPDQGCEAMSITSINKHLRHYLKPAWTRKVKV